MISGLVIVVIGQEERLGRDRVRLASSHNKGLVRSPGAMLGQSKGASTARLDLVGTHRQPEGKACDVVEGNYSQLSVVLTNGQLRGPSEHSMPSCWEESCPQRGSEHIVVVFTFNITTLRDFTEFSGL